jgi:hypothetical protein
MTGSAWAVESGVDARVAFYRWEEDLQPIAPLETGPMAFVGIWLQGTPLKARPALRLRGDLRLLVGDVNYDTALIAAPSVPVSTRTEYLGAIQEVSVGRRVLRKRGFIEPFAGLAYRWWLRSIESTSTVTGYDEWYRTLVLRLGIRGQREISARTNLYWEFSGDPMLWAKEDIELGPPVGTLHLNNGKRIGWTIETGLRARVIDMGVFWQAVRLGESTVDSGFFQPKSDQDIIGAKLTLSF